MSAKEIPLEQIEHWKQMVPSEYLRGVDLLESGDKGATLTIKEVRVSEEFLAAKGHSKQKPSIRFEKTPKIWGPCNECLAELQEAYGPPRNWAGKKITVYAKMGVRNPSDGKTGPGVRIKTCHNAGAGQ